MSLSLAGWAKQQVNYPDPKFSEAICRIAKYGARVGYKGPIQAICRPNLVSAQEALEVINRDLESNLKNGRVVEIQELGHRFMVSPLCLVPKPFRGCRRIHHLSTPPNHSVKDYIPRHYGHLKYSLFSDALDQVRMAGQGAILIKRDLADAFWHIPIHPADWWLFGFEWRGRFFQESFLPFGLQMAPQIFNFFSEGLHWILESRSFAAIRHYLDDFLAIFTATDRAAATDYEQTFEEICRDLGLQINITKHCSGTSV